MQKKYRITKPLRVGKMHNIHSKTNKLYRETIYCWHNYNDL